MGKTSNDDIPPWEPVTLDLTIPTPIPEVDGSKEFPYDDEIPW